MSQTLKRKDDHVLSPSTKKARLNVVYRLATDVHRIQLESANLESRTDGSSSCAGPKYGSIKTLIEEAEKIYPWINRHKVYNGVRLIKRRLTKSLSSSRVLEFPRPSTIINPPNDNDDANQKSG